MRTSQLTHTDITLPRNKREARAFVKRFPGLVTEVAERCHVRICSVTQVLQCRMASQRISRMALVVAGEFVEQGKDTAAKTGGNGQ